jgi:hypothetical protein
MRTGVCLPTSERDVSTARRIPSFQGIEGWAVLGSNQRPPACKSEARSAPTEPEEPENVADFPDPKASAPEADYRELPPIVGD